MAGAYPGSSKHEMGASLGQDTILLQGALTHTPIFTHTKITDTSVSPHPKDAHTGMWEETGAPEENSRRHGENLQAPHRQWPQPGTDSFSLINIITK